jgi:hypothetical protein
MALHHICAGRDKPGLARAQAAVDTGALDAVAGAMRAHARRSALLEHACWVLANLTAGQQHAQAATDAGALAAVLDAMRAYTRAPMLQEQGCATLANLTGGRDAAARARAAAAVKAGAKHLAADALAAHADDAPLVEAAQRLLANLAA